VRLAQGKFADARRLYGDLNADPAVVASHDFRLQAQLGYARCQIGQKQYRAAAETVKEKILQAKRTETPRLDHYRAQAWIIWGIADEGLATGDREKLEWALIHYLRGAILAGSGNREDLAEALYRAKEIWKRLGQDERAEELKQRLSKLCPDSPWNK
ncbi:MAG: hypothetical protein ACE5GW_12220, partial [Planctomycetota bacterium]